MDAFENTGELFVTFFLLLSVVVSHPPRLPPVQGLQPAHLATSNKHYKINDKCMEYYTTEFFKWFTYKAKPSAHNWRNPFGILPLYHSEVTAVNELSRLMDMYKISSKFYRTTYVYWIL